MTIAMSAAKRRLSVVWFTGAALLSILMIGQTILGHYEDAEDAWSWLLPGIVPTLSLIVGVLVVDALGKGAADRRVDRFMFRVALGLSLFYLLLVAAPVLMQPFAQLPPGELLKLSNLWLAPAQGLVSAALAAFFVKKD